MSHQEDEGKPIEVLGKTYEHQLADGEYDVVFFSTGLKECILAGLLSVRGWKVLQLDRNAYYGGACASLNLEELYAHYKKPYDAKAVEQQFGPPRRFCVDLVPKFLMANGDVVKMLIQSGVTRYIEFQGIAGSYVVASSMFSSKGSIYRVPVTPAEALKSSLVGALQKRSLMNFATWLDKYQPRDKQSDDTVMGWTDEEFAAQVKQYCATHGESVVPTGTNRLQIAQQLEQKFVLPLAPVEVDVTFQAGPLGLKIEAKPFVGSKSAGVKSATRVVGFQSLADGKPGQGEQSGKLREGDLIAKVNHQSVLGLPDQEVTKRLVESPRPVVVTFIRIPAPIPAGADAPNSDLRKTTMGQLYTHFGLDDNSQTFIGHAMALETSDAYVQQPAEKTVEAVHMYGRSVGRYGQNSPYLYPLYGLSTLPEGFSRLSAIYGGTVMLRAPEHEILVDPKTGKVAGVRVGNKAAKCRFVIGDASYFPPNQSLVLKKVARSICLLKHAIKDTTDGDSAQIILPAKTLKGKKHDIYISCVSKTHEVSSPGVYLVICSTVAETSDPFGAELAPAFEFLGQIEQRFDSVTEVRGPSPEASKLEGSGQVICEGLDETSHFESAAADIAKVYRKVFGKPLDLTEKLVPDQAE